MTATIGANLDELVSTFVSPLRQELEPSASISDVLTAATRRRPQLLVVLETVVVQVSVTIFELDIDYGREAYKPLQKKLADKRWLRRVPPEVTPLGNALSRVLNSWPDLVASGYSSPASLGQDLMCDLIPSLMRRLAKYGDAKKDSALSTAANGAATGWVEVFHAR